MFDTMLITLTRLPRASGTLLLALTVACGSGAVSFDTDPGDTGAGAGDGSGGGGDPLPNNGDSPANGDGPNNGDGPTAGDSAPPPTVEAPTLTLTDATVFLWIGDAFVEPGFAATDDQDGDLTASVVVTGTVDSQTAGLYTLTYSVTDSDDNSVEATRYVYVIAVGTTQKIPIGPSDVTRERGTGDATLLADEQTLAGDPLSSTGGATTTLWGSTDGTNSLPHHAAIDLGQPWVVQHVFFRDASGSGALQVSPGGPGVWREPMLEDGLTTFQSWRRHDVQAPTRFVRVTKQTQSGIYEIVLYGYPITDLGAPIISLVGPAYTNVRTGTFYLDYGANAVDDFEGDLSAAITVEGLDAVDANVAGDYVITYRVEDDAGNEATPRTRVVHVADDVESDRTVEDLTLAERIILEHALLMDSPVQPPLTHPRLYGDNDRWLAWQAPLDEMPCVAGSTTGWGVILDVTDLWHTRIFGGTPCGSGYPADIADHPSVNYYLNATGSWNRDTGLRVMHLLRRQRHCLANGGICPYSEAETDQLAEAFIDSEIARFPSETWHKGYDGSFFDLGAGPAFQFWCTFLDTFWDEPLLADLDRDAIEAKMSDEIDSFLDLYATEHWALFNGNNWTPVLAMAALTWAITFYHEDVRAPEVLRAALEVEWLHRDFILDDGSYKEGVFQYTPTSVLNVLQMNRLLLGSFDRPLDSLRWEVFSGIADWYIELMAPDGTAVDFGDSWDVRGFGAFDPLYALLWPEVRGDVAPGTLDPDPCTVKLFFANVYHGNGFNDPAGVEPAMARDWKAIVDQCQSDVQPGTQVTLFEDGGVGALRTFVPGATVAATDTSTLRLAQADQTFLAVSAVPNTFPHRELDFGAIIWSAYGTRLLWDFGYGKIVNASAGRYNLTANFDYLPYATNTVVVPEAHDAGNVDTDASQVLGYSGSIAQLSLDGHAGLHLIGDEVYGATDATLGWMEQVDRWTLALDDGNFLVVDALRVKSSRPEAAVREHWYTARDTETDCNSFSTEVVPTVDGSGIRLTPLCHGIDRGEPAEAIGKILGASAEGGGFTLDTNPITITTQTSTTVTRHRFIYEPTAPIRSDVRAFLLLSAVGTLPAASLAYRTCGPDHCFDITVDGSTTTLRIAEATRYSLVGFE